MSNWLPLALLCFVFLAPLWIWLMRGETNDLGQKGDSPMSHSDDERISEDLRAFMQSVLFLVFDDLEMMEACQDRPTAGLWGEKAILDLQRLLGRLADPPPPTNFPP